MTFRDEKHENNLDIFESGDDFDVGDDLDIDDIIQISVSNFLRVPSPARLLEILGFFEIFSF